MWEKKQKVLTNFFAAAEMAAGHGAGDTAEVLQPSWPKAG
jgi:hypothetical protein